MWLRRFIIFLIISFAYGQSIHNAYGLGLISFNHNAADAAMSSRGIIPTLNQHISLSNPVTWNNLKFAYLTGNYTGNEFTSDDGENGLTGISSAQFAVPIGEKYAWGFGVKPLFNQQYLIEDDQAEFYVQDDTLITKRSVDGSGGISIFYTALRFPVSAMENIAIELDILFGSLRKDSKLSIDQSVYHFFQRHLYSGSLYKIHFSSARLNSGKYPLNIYATFGGVLNSLKLKHHSFQPFEDVNLNGYYDGEDNPSPAIIPSIEIDIYDNIFKPTELGIGFDWTLNSGLHMMLEMHNWQDTGKKNQTLYPLLSHYVNQSQQVSLSFAKFSPEIAFKLSQKMQYRGGIYLRTDKMEEKGFQVNEMGISLGFGIKFGVANNQIDFAYRHGIRSGDFIQNENIQLFTVGLQLGDLWFVKRRPK